MKPDLAIPLLATLLAFSSQRLMADVPNLSLAADRCAIGYALTGRPMPGCQPPEKNRYITRSVNTSTSGYYVHFGLDSKDLSEAAVSHLQRLSNLLGGPLADLCIKLVGHTDTSGSANYNAVLSEKRAKTVYLYLAGPGNIHASRLNFEGRGETSPLPQIPGTAAENRRVEILAKKSQAGLCN